VIDIMVEAGDFSQLSFRKTSGRCTIIRNVDLEHNRILISRSKKRPLKS